MSADLIFLHGRHLPRCIASVDKRFTYHTLQLMTAGGVELRYADRCRQMRGRWLWPCQPGPPIRFHNWPAGEPWEHRYIAFTGPRVTQWEAQGLWPTDAEPVADDEAPHLAALFDRIIDSALQPRRWGWLRAANLLEQILLDRAEKHGPHASSHPDWLHAVMERLAEIDGDEPDYPSLAERHGLSLTTLQRHFRQATGTSLHHYRLDCRIAAARRLLGDTDLPIKQIAVKLGYRDVFYFTRQFRQRAGVSPAAYRRSRQKRE